MLYRKALILIVLSLLIVSALMAATDPNSSTAGKKMNRMSSTAINNRFIIFEDGPTFVTENYSDHSLSEMKTEEITVPFCGSDASVANAEFFREQVRISRERFENDNNKKITGREALFGFNIVFNIGGAVPPEAVTAMGTVETYLESMFSDPLTITIDFDYAALGPGILGSTSVTYTASPPSWTATRAGLVGGMDYDDYIEANLPSGSTIPVRYDGASPTVTNEDRCFFALANYGAAIGSISVTSAHITFSSNFSWDYDPTNGVSGSAYCFQSVVIHEIGHALGFVSRAESWYDPTSDIISLDIYRFQRTDGTGDYNPDEYRTPSLPVWLITIIPPRSELESLHQGADVEYRMSDGDPIKHHTFVRVFPAIMDPSMGSGSTFSEFLSGG
jgi:hypothetical protein